MFNIHGKDYQFTIGISIKVSESTVQYRHWLEDNVGREYGDWTSCILGIRVDSFTFQIFFHSEAHLALFKLTML